MQPVEVVLIGEAMACFTTAAGRLVDAVDFTRSFGGAEANVAVGLSRLGVSTAFVSVVGDDPLGRGIIRRMRAEGVSVAGVLTDPDNPTGMMIKEVRSAEDVRVFFYRSTSAAASLAPERIIGSETEGGWLHVTGITLGLGAGMAASAAELARRTRGVGGRVSFDPNIRLKLTTASEATRRAMEFLPLVDDLLLSEDEAAVITGERSLEAILTSLEALAVQRIVLRRGERGAIGLVEGERIPVAATAPREVVDTVGAGDASTAGYIFGQLRGHGFEESLRIAAWSSGEVVCALGDHEGAPWLDDFEAWSTGSPVVQR